MTRKMTAWSITHGMKVTRVSAEDAKGGEHYTLVPHIYRGADHRERLDAARVLVEQHAASGADPSEVELTEA